MEQQSSNNQLSVAEQASLTSGSDAWHLQGIPDQGLEGYMMTDGPHGLRKTSADSQEVNLDKNVPATCFPPAAGLASSWNCELVHRVGRAIAEECIEEKVAVILGPGVNIKRNPLGGRNFEYWSEDPFLTGCEGRVLVIVATLLISGVDDHGLRVRWDSVREIA